MKPLDCANNDAIYNGSHYWIRTVVREAAAGKDICVPGKREPGANGTVTRIKYLDRKWLENAARAAGESEGKEPYACFMYTLTAKGRRATDGNANTGTNGGPEKETTGRAHSAVLRMYRLGEMRVLTGEQIVDGHAVPWHLPLWLNAESGREAMEQYERDEANAWKIISELLENKANA